MNKSELQDTLIDLNDQIQFITQQADAEQRDITAGEARHVDSLFAKFKATEAELATYESQGRKSEPQQPMAQHRGISPTNTEISTSQAKPYAGRKIADLFGRTKAADRGGFKSNGEFLQAVANGLHHPALRNATMTEGTGADGGFTVPSQLMTQIFDESLESELIRPRARVYPMASSNLQLSHIDYEDHSSNIGGLDGTWFGEASTQTAQKAKFRQLTLTAHKLGIFCEASSEVVMDGLLFESVVIDAMSKSLSFDLDYAFIRGTGAGQPTGILNSNSTISVAKDTSTSPVQPADTLRFKNLVDMWSRLHPALANDAIWIINPEVLPQLLTLSYPGSTDTPLFIPNQNAGNETPGTIFGRPLFFSEKCSALGDQGDIILVAPSMYAIGMRLDAAFDRSIHEGFMKDTVNFRLITRVDGEAIMNAAVTPRYGANTLSWAVILDDRT